MFLKGITVLLISSALAIAASLLLNYLNLCYSPNWWWSPIFFSVIFLVVNLVHNLKTDPSTSTEIVIGSISIKALLLMVAIFVYSVVDQKGLFCFSMHFLSHYILFTVFEIRYLLHVIKSKES